MSRSAPPASFVSSWGGDRGRRPGWGSRGGSALGEGRCAVSLLAFGDGSALDRLISTIRDPCEKTQQGLLIEARGSIVVRDAGLVERLRLVHRQTGRRWSDRPGSGSRSSARRTDGGSRRRSQVAARRPVRWSQTRCSIALEAEIGHLGGSLRLVRLAFQAFPYLAQESDPAQGRARSPWSSASASRAMAFKPSRKASSSAGESACSAPCRRVLPESGEHRQTIGQRRRRRSGWRCRASSRTLAPDSFASGIVPHP